MFVSSGLLPSTVTDTTFFLTCLSSSMSSPGDVFVNPAEDRIGSKYKKVVYREFENGEFTEHKKRTPREQHLQILGERLGQAAQQ